MKDKGWHIPLGVNIAFTTRRDGVSSAPYGSLNLGLHVGDADKDVLANRVLVQERFNIPAVPAWLNQIHGTDVVKADNCLVQNADGSYSDSREQVCVVMTADCLPILLCDQSGSEVAAIHAGWKGLSDGIVEVALGKFKNKNHSLIAYLGPAIGPENFEVGVEVKERFVSQHTESKIYFTKKATLFPSQITDVENTDKYFADLQGLAVLRLKLAGVTEIYQSDMCTFNHPDDYFSYRRDHITGRMASYIWLT